MKNHIARTVEARDNATTTEEREYYQRQLQTLLAADVRIRDHELARS